MNRELVICRGYPASGKTTWAKSLVSNVNKVTNISRDDIRFNYLHLPNGIGTKEEEETVTMIQHNMVNELLSRDWTVIVDDTNLPLKRAREWADYAKMCQAKFAVVDFPTSVEECIKRDLLRGSTLDAHGRPGRMVGAEVIRGMASRFKFPLPDVTASEAPHISSGIYIADETLPRAWVVDIDGTLAEMTGRSPYDYSRVLEDDLRVAVSDMVWALSKHGDKIIVMSGRPDSCRNDTEYWLSNHSIPWHELWMRATDDKRRDSIIKSELFFTHVAPRYNVIGTIDDRASVVATWRSMGLMCAQVAPGNF